jgi:hypothetical protein
MVLMRASVLGKLALVEYPLVLRPTIVSHRQRQVTGGVMTQACLRRDSSRVVGAAVESRRIARPLLVSGRYQ